MSKGSLTFKLLVAVAILTLVLLGMMGAGKTTVGRALAARTGWR